MATKPRDYSSLDDDALLAEYEDKAEFGNFLDFIGRHGKRVEKNTRQMSGLEEEITSRGLNTSDLDIQEEFTGQDAGRFVKDMGKKGERPRKSRLTKQAQAAHTRKEGEETQAYMDEHIEPAFDAAQQQINELLENPLFSPAFSAKVRSDIANQVHKASASQFARAAAGLGIRGISLNTGVAAAVAAADAQEYDMFLVDQLRQQGMAEEQLEQSSKMMEADAAARLAAQRAAVRTATLEPDKQRLMMIENDLAGLFESIRQQNDLRKMLNDLERQGSGDGLAGAIQGMMSGAATGAMAGGPWGAVAGAGVGGALGYMGKDHSGAGQALSQAPGLFASGARAGAWDFWRGPSSNPTTKFGRPRDMTMPFNGF
jgi:hypothetical protein